MGFISTMFLRLFGLISVTIIVAFILLHISYIPIRDGKLYLRNAESTATLLREADTGIQHI